MDYCGSRNGRRVYANLYRILLLLPCLTVLHEEKNDKTTGYWSDTSPQRASTTRTWPSKSQLCLEVLAQLGSSKCLQCINLTQEAHHSIFTLNFFKAFNFDETLATIRRAVQTVYSCDSVFSFQCLTLSPRKANILAWRSLINSRNFSLGTDNKFCQFNI